MIDLLILAKGLLGIILFFGSIIAVAWWWSNGVCNALGQMMETRYILFKETPEKAESRIKIQTNILLAELIASRNLDNEVVECIKRSHKYPLEYIEMYLRGESWTNQLFRDFYCLDADQKHIDLIRKCAVKDGFDQDEKVKEYLDWQESTKVRNLTRNPEYLDIYGV